MENRLYRYILNVALRQAAGVRSACFAVHDFFRAAKAMRLEVPNIPEDVYEVPCLPNETP